jgi:hypothetical protein
MLPLPGRRGLDRVPTHLLINPFSEDAPLPESVS